MALKKREFTPESGNVDTYDTALKNASEGTWALSWDQGEMGW